VGTALLVGSFGLLGVIVGGVVNGLVATGLERVREARLAMVTARLVQSDLLYIAAVVTAEIQEGKWKRLAQGAPPVSFDSWKGGRDALAGGLRDYEKWAVVEVAARQAMRVVVVAPTNPKPAGTALSSAESQNLGTLVPDMTKGVETLQPLAHGVHVPPLWRAMLRPGLPGTSRR
jgi:hypothetical protein